MRAIGNLVVFGLIFCLLCNPVSGFVIEDSDYIAEVWASYDVGAYAGVGDVQYVEGNIYLAYGDGAVMKVESGGPATILIDSYPNHQSIEWGGGTPYEDKLYISSPYTDEVIASDLNGNTSSFCTVNAQPLGLGFDRVGNYGGKLYVGTRYPGEIYSVSETGQAEFFIAVNEPEDAHINAFTFDHTGMYDGLMFISISSKLVAVEGIFSVDPDGIMTQHLTATAFNAIAFDTTDDLQFDGELYMQRSSYAIKRMAPDGTSERFIYAPDTILRRFTFGPDGMYVLEEADGVVTVYKITRLPEPSLLEQVVEHIEEAIAQKAVALEAVESSLAEEQTAYDLFGEMLDTGDYCGLTQQEIDKTVKKLEISIAGEGRVMTELEESIFWLERVLTFLAVEE